MDCLEVRANLVAAIDGELDPEVATQVNDHLAGCSECRDERDRLRRTMQLATAWVPDAPNVMPDIRAALDHELLASLVEQVATLTSEVKSLRAEIAELKGERPIAPPPNAVVNVTEADTLRLLEETQRTSIRAVQARKRVEDPWNLAIS